MKDWAPIILSIIGSGGLAMYVLNAIGKAYTARQEARTADKVADLKKIDDLQKQIFSMQQDRIAEEVKRRTETDNSTKVQMDTLALLKALIDKKGITP